MSEKLAIQIRIELRDGISAAERDTFIASLESEIVDTLSSCEEVADVGQMRVVRERKFGPKPASSRVVN